MNAEEIRLVLLEENEQMRAHQELQHLVWGHDPPDAVPAHLLKSMSRLGGIVLGAYADEQMVGLLLSLPALYHSRLIHYSHLLGTHPGWRGSGIGERLKWRQRELVVAMGLDTVIWTYDPMEAINARLNIGRLGGIVRSYYRNYYGPMSDALNGGIESDRFMLEWPLNSPRVTHRASTGRIAEMRVLNMPIALDVVSNERGLIVPGSFKPLTDATAVLVALPEKIQQIKSESLDAALAWRQALRHACETLFATGYTITDVVRRQGQPYYYLEQRFSDH